MLPAGELDFTPDHTSNVGHEGKKKAVLTILREPYLIKLLALASGLGYVTVIYRVPTLGNHGLSGLFALSVVVLGPLTVALVVFAGKGSWIIVPLLIYIGVVGGIMLDVVLDTKTDRNLFPIEIVLWSVVVVPILAISAAAGWFLKNKTSLKDRLAE